MLSSLSSLGSQFSPLPPVGSLMPSFAPMPSSASLFTTGSADLNGYNNRFAKVTTTARPPAEVRPAEAAPVSRVYTIEFMMSLRQANKERPSNMSLLEFPHKKKRQMRTHGENEADKFNFTVRELRILLNKLSKDNFDNVTKHILNDYQFTPALLNELMKIIFMKATTESTYLELYVRLCIFLFRKYNDKENVEMNFKKLLLNKC